jgi:hypothetical protein
MGGVLLGWIPQLEVKAMVTPPTEKWVVDYNSWGGGYVLVLSERGLPFQNWRQCRVLARCWQCVGNFPSYLEEGEVGFNCGNASVD